MPNYPSGRNKENKRRIPGALGTCPANLTCPGKILQASGYEFFRCEYGIEIKSKEGAEQEKAKPIAQQGQRKRKKRYLKEAKHPHIGLGKAPALHKDVL